jgi:hypothetical protein
MGGACNTDGGKEKFIHGFMGNSEAKKWTFEA